MLTTKDKQQIQEELIEFVKLRGSGAKAADKIGVSHPTVSNILNNKWEGIADKMWRRIQAVVSQQNLQLVETNNLARIYNLCEDAQANRRFLAIKGYSGAGKTTALKMYTRQHRAQGAFYVHMYELMTKNEVLREIAREVGAKITGSQLDIVRSIVVKLLEMPNPVLIVDDIGKLSVKKMQFLQVIYDMTKDKIGIVISGVDYTYDNLNKAVNKEEKGAPELKRRIESVLELKPPRKADVLAMCKANGLDREDLQRVVLKHCGNFGCIEKAIKHYKRIDPEVDAEEFKAGIMQFIQ